MKFIQDCDNINEVIEYLLERCDIGKQKYLSDMTGTHYALTVLRPIDFQEMIDNANKFTN